ncbi:MAG: hypothetical protein Q8914_03065, partial [Bacteroidota bacterium]|nr:hypothetical protein [Bacteroidota bacterium]
SVPGITLTLGGGTNVWSVSDSTFTFDKATYVAGLNGNTNPVDGNGKKFSASGVPPTVGAFYKFDAAVDGTLDAAIIINSGKNSYIVEDATALIGYNPFTVAVKTYASYSIPVKTGKSYYFFSEASKMGIMGFVFKSQTGTVNPAQTANVVYTSAGVLYIKSAKADQAVVYDLLGKKILSTKLNEGLNEFSGLAHGSYIVKIGIETTKAVL